MLNIEFIGDFDREKPEGSTVWNCSGPFVESHILEEAVNPEIGLVIWHISAWENLKLLLEKRPNARLLSVSNGNATLEGVQKEVEELNLKEEDQNRIYGSSQKGSIGKIFELWEDLMQFFAHGKQIARIEHFLGRDLPVQRLALRFALEISLQELRSWHSGNPASSKNKPLTIDCLLQPVFLIDQETPKLRMFVNPIKEAVQNLEDLPPLIETINRVLCQLLENE
ncbi:MAG: hypothetical protein K1Y36_25745 [Blastocatellia bacterium]|nr:hypothetical protein [Blastocatellia bacterium]